MGNKISIPNSQVFQDDLKALNETITNVINEKNLFRNDQYNFLSKDVCDKHTVVLEEELNRHLKVSLQSLGTSLYLVPNNDNNNKANIKGSSLTKKQICEKISNHYMRILYIISLIKYVYDIERHGDYSIAGIIFRNIKLVDDIMVIDYCNIPHKDYSNPQKHDKINFGQLEGLSFFTNFVLNHDESRVFVDVLKSILSRSSKGVVKNYICKMKKSNMLTTNDLYHIEQLYKNKYGASLVCSNTDDESVQQAVSTTAERKVSLYMRIEKDNPVFLKEYCFNTKKALVKMDTPTGKEIVAAFRAMQKNYKTNIKNVEKLLTRLVSKRGGAYELNDITKQELDSIVAEVKSTIKVFFIQSIMDYQHLLDLAKNNQTIQISKDTY